MTVLTRRRFLHLTAGGGLAWIGAGCRRPSPERREPAGATVRLFLGGDVMTGRGVDQVLRHPGDPRVYEPAVSDAREYVRLAEQRHGRIPAPVAFAYVWGDALAELDRRRPDARIVNLETAVTTSDDRQDKVVLYRMHPKNVGCLAAARIDACALANNHALDWGRAGLDETLAILHAAELATAGAGADAAAARAPAVIERDDGRRVLVFSLGHASAGIPDEWAATATRAGIHVVPDLSERSAAAVAAGVAEVARPGDRVVVSIHWGPNWGYQVPDEQRRFAHALIDRGAVDVVHGHSSHHAKAIEVHRGRPILYGCGDLLNDATTPAGCATHSIAKAVGSGPASSARTKPSRCAGNDQRGSAHACRRRIAWAARGSAAPRRAVNTCSACARAASPGPQPIAVAYISSASAYS